MKPPVIDKKIWNTWREFELNEESPRFFLDLIEKFLENTPNLFLEFLDAIKNKDLKKIVYCSHTLASSCASLGAVQLSEYLKEIEDAARSKNPSIKIDHMSAIESHFAEVLHEMKMEQERLQNLAS
jgi:HPt (histidine-containing phosphotransfer) domain-containing protein